MEEPITYRKRVEEHLDDAFKQLKIIRNILDTSGDTWKIMIKIDEAKNELSRIEEIVRIVSRKAFDEIFVEE